MESATVEADSRVGSVLAEKYRLLRVLGAGGMGSVYEAENEWTGRRVALKVLHGAMARDKEATARFMREARATTKVGHPNIVEVLDMGQNPVDGALYIVQEYLVGYDLRALLTQRRRLEPLETLELLMPVMSALVAAHRHGIVHRDIKPENIYVSKNSEGRRVPKLIDFGIAKFDGGRDGLGLTRTGAAMGTPYYMSPEQARGDRVIDAQTDVWAIGTVLFETLSGECPFDGENYNQLLAKILTAPIPRLSGVAPWVPPPLVRVVQGALQRDKAERFSSMAIFLDALINASDFAGPEWQRSTRRWFDRQVGSFDDDVPTSFQVPDSTAEWKAARAGNDVTQADAASRWALQAPSPSNSLLASGSFLASANADDDDDESTSIVASSIDAAPAARVSRPLLTPQSTLLGPGTTPLRSEALSVVPPPPPQPLQPPAQVANAPNAPTPPFLGAATPPPHQATGGFPAYAGPSSVAWQPAQSGVQHAAPSTPVTKPTRLALVLGALGLGAVLLGGGVAVALRSGSAPTEPTTVAHSSALTPTAASSASSPPTAATAATFRVMVRVEPAFATIDLDGEPLQGNVLVREFPRDGRSHQLVVNATGYESQSIDFVDTAPNPVISLTPRRALPTAAPRPHATAQAVAQPAPRPSAPPVAAHAPAPTPSAAAPAPTARPAARPARPSVRVVRDYDDE